MAAVTGYKVNSGGTYVDLNTLFEAGSGGSASGYKIAGGSDLNTVFAPYVSGPQAILTNYKNASGNDLNIVFSKLKKWGFIGSSNFGFNGAVRAFVVDSLGNIYVGGEFTALNGGTPGTFNYIAKMAFNSSTWTTVGSGAGGFNNRVYALAIDSNNNLYAGGQFTAIFGGTANTLSRVASSAGGSGAWTTIGSSSGLNGTVYALAIDSNNKLYAGGQFTAAVGGGANTLNRVASSAGGTGVWTAIGTSTGGGFDNIVLALAVDSNNKLYAGGRFTAIFGGTLNTLNHVASSLGGVGSWTAIGTGTGGGFSDDVLALVVDSNNNLYAGGSFTATFVGTANTLNRVARSAGGTGSWTAIGSSSGGGFSGTVNALVVDSNNNLYAGGIFSEIFGGTLNTLNRIARSAGGTGVWAAIREGFNDIVYTLAIDSSENLYAGGAFTALYGGTANTLNNVAKYA